MMKYIALLFFFVIFALAVNQDMRKGHKHEQPLIPSNQALTMTDVQAAFAQEGSPLEVWEHSQRFYTLKGVVPAFYKADSGEFAIYVFKSDEERVQGREDFDTQTATAKVALSNIYEVRNVLIFEFRRTAQNMRIQKVIDALNGSAKHEMLSIEKVKAALQQQGIELDPSDFKYELVRIRSKNRIQL